MCFSLLCTKEQKGDTWTLDEIRRMQKRRVNYYIIFTRLPVHTCAIFSGQLLSTYETVYHFDFNKHFIPLVSLLQRIAGFHAWDFKVLKLMTTSLSNALTTWACCIGFQVVVIFKRAATQTQSPYSEGGGTILWLWSFTFLLLISNETSSSFPRYLPKLRPRQVVAGCCRT